MLISPVVLLGRYVGCRVRDRLAVELGALRCASHVQDGRREIDMGADEICCPVFGNPGSANYQRDVDVLFECILLPGSEPVMSEVEAIVAGIDDERVIKLFGILQNVYDAFYEVIDGEEGLGPALVVLV